MTVAFVNLTFHHVDPSQKLFAMSMAVGRSIAAFREKARKCVLVCANCHGEIEAGLTKSPPAGTKFRARPKAAQGLSAGSGGAS
jgi:cytochrome c553